MLKNFMESIDRYQYPDTITIAKQRDEGARFKGFWISCKRHGVEDTLKIEYDVTPHYTRVLGNTRDIPIFTAGKHVYRDNK